MRSLRLSFLLRRRPRPFSGCRRRRWLGTNAAAVRLAVKRSGAPSTVGLIEDECMASPDACAFVREIGCMRRVFLLNPHLSSDQMEGLAYRIRTLTKNEGLNSVLIATDHRSEDDGALPSLVRDRGGHEPHDLGDDEGFPPAPNQTFFVAGGYDPLELYKQGQHTDAAVVERLLSRLSDLMAACAGHANHTKIPTICVPHGAVTDGGFAFLRSSYVLCTRESSFRILNPSRGLSLDPVGLSFYLPRLGREFQQPAAQYPGVGLLLALTGFEANSMDLLETGLATHNLESTNGLGLLEHMLSELPPWEQQGLLKNPARVHGHDPPTVDHNAAFRNYVVADCIDTAAGLDRADGQSIICRTTEEELARHHIIDPSLEPDPTPFWVDRSSMLVDYAATFDNLFQSHRTVHGLWEGLHEIGQRHSDDPLEQEGIAAAADLAARLQRQSPLAVSVIHQLLLRGLPNAGGSNKPGDDTLQACIRRERWVQTQMFQKEDFARWAEHTRNNPDATEPFTDWKHKSLADVPTDEVAEIFAMPDKQQGSSSNREEDNNNNKPPPEIPPLPPTPPRQ